MSDIVIEINGVSKAYKLYKKPSDRAKEALNPFRKKYHQDFYALQDISFKVQRGETLGIIGKNGSGKSTLLKILTEVLTPSTGSVHVQGKVSSLLELGVGFNPELTGLENIYFNGAILGYTKVEMEKKLKDILNFADIGEFIHQAVKTYSSGMQVRLAFAVAINVNPEILFIDEALSVGDIRFQLKCMRKLRELKESGKTIIFVTHDMGAIMNYCSRAIWLDDGRIQSSGLPEKVCKEYTAFMTYDQGTQIGKIPKINSKDGKNGKAIPFQSVAHCSSFGEKNVEITDIAFYDPITFLPIKLLEGGETVVFAAKIKSLIKVKDFIFGFMVTDEYGNNIIGMNNYLIRQGAEVTKNELVIFAFEFQFPKFKDGHYTLVTSVAEGSQLNHIQHHWIHDAHHFQVVSTREIGKLNILLEPENVKFIRQ
ncbi:ABC transporter ATP-binding protein [Candidatus Peregrinibacteria bacterium CG_4_10_14_0_2_um_filter_43_11]|nr:MAG: ABC transporter ATP-binding protein [Candidatus Peregrinibacteria bacterium CG_4_10_14_0_2_um_filter_43_11]